MLKNLKYIIKNRIDNYIVKKEYIKLMKSDKSNKLTELQLLDICRINNGINV